jgi:transposase InsO family protein
LTASIGPALAVRDLTSGFQLAWQPVSDQTAAPAAAVLQSLIDEHGPPMLLKSDNGSAFLSETFAKVLAEHEIVWLPSPARMPWYNGSCEAGNGSMRTRTNHFASGTTGWTRRSLESESDSTRIAPMSLADRSPQAILRPPDRDQMNQRLGVRQYAQIATPRSLHQSAITST